MKKSLDGFTFFTSYYNSAQHLTQKDQAIFYKMIIDYAFSGKEPNEKGHLMGYWELTKPNIDTSIARSKAGKSKNKDGTNAEQNGNKDGTKEEQNGNKGGNVTSKEKEKEKEKEKDKDKDIKKETKKVFSFTLLQKHSFEFLSQEYVDHLKAYIEKSDYPMTYEHFSNTCMANGYKYKNFSLAYLNWAKKSFNTSTPSNSNTPEVGSIAWQMEQEAKAEQEIIDV